MAAARAGREQEQKLGRLGELRDGRITKCSNATRYPINGTSDLQDSVEKSTQGARR
jgi:hypothetical protein